MVLALFALGLVNALGGDGILVVYVTGLAYNHTVSSSIYEQEREVEEGINQILVLPLFVLLGVVLPWQEWSERGAPVFAFTVAEIWPAASLVVAASTLAHGVTAAPGRALYARAPASSSPPDCPHRR